MFGYQVLISLRKCFQAGNSIESSGIPVKYLDFQPLLLERNSTKSVICSQRIPPGDPYDKPSWGKTALSE